MPRKKIRWKKLLTTVLTVGMNLIIKALLRALAKNRIGRDSL